MLHRRRTVLDKGAVAVALLAGLSVVFVLMVLYSSSVVGVKTVREASFEAQIRTNKTRVYEVGDESVKDSSWTVWGATRAAGRRSCDLLAAHLGCFATASLAAVLGGMVQIFEHDPARRMRRRWCFVTTGVGRLGFFFPLFAALYVIALTAKFDGERNGLFDNDVFLSSGERVTRVDIRWSSAVVGRIEAGAAAVAALVFAAQLWLRTTLSLGRTSLAEAHAFLFSEEDDEGSSLRWMTVARRPPHRRGFTAVPLLLSACFLTLGLFLPIATVTNRARQTVVLSENTTIEVARFSSEETLDFSVWSFFLSSNHGRSDDSSRNGRFLSALLAAVCVVLPVARAYGALVLWFAPLTRFSHQLARLFMEYASVLVAHDLFLALCLVCHVDLDKFGVVDDDDDSSKYTVSFRLNGGCFAVLVVATLADALTSAWLRCRLACAVDGKPTAFAAWLHGGDDDLAISSGDCSVESGPLHPSADDDDATADEDFYLN